MAGSGQPGITEIMTGVTVRVHDRSLFPSPTIARLKEMMLEEKIGQQPCEAAPAEQLHFSAAAFAS